MKLIRQLTLILVATHSIAHGIPTKPLCLNHSRDDSAWQIAYATLGCVGLVTSYKIYGAAAKLKENNYPCTGKTVEIIGHASAIATTFCIANGFIYGSGIMDAKECTNNQ